MTPGDVRVHRVLHGAARALGLEVLVEMHSH